MAPADGLAADLAQVVGTDHVLRDADRRAPYETDWTRRFAGRARLVVRPGSTTQVAAVLRACGAHGARVVPQGGDTGLVGGGVPRDGEVVVSTLRLDELGPVDVAAAQVTVGAGCTLGAVQAHVTADGLEVGIDHAARDSATIGGMVATNAGGIHAVRHGSMRSRVVGLEVVRADGQILAHLGGLAKDNTGYDLAGLVTGSEGTLAVVTAARLRLLLRPRVRVTALVGLADLGAAVDVTARLRGLAALEAVEFVDAPSQEALRAHTGLPEPLAASAPIWLLASCAGSADPLDELAEALGPHARTAVVATERAEREALWAYRERITESIGAAGVAHKLDVSVPIPALPDFVPAVGEAVAAVDPAARVLQFGHLGDGNVHVNVLDAADGAAVDAAVLPLVAAHGGAISAEHGIGVAKPAWLHLSRSSAEIATMRAIKAAWDPDGLLNPGVLLP